MTFEKAQQAEPLYYAIRQYRERIKMAEENIYKEILNYIQQNRDSEAVRELGNKILCEIKDELAKCEKELEEL